jgi:hypothetical protein
MASILAHPRRRRFLRAVNVRGSSFVIQDGRREQPEPVSCARKALIGGPGTGWPARVGAGLKCKAFTVEGRQRIDGIDTIKMTMLGGIGTLWVDPATYLPVRTTLALGVERTQTDFRWLPPTPANLARLQVTIPAGFTQVPAPRARPAFGQPGS